MPCVWKNRGYAECFSRPLRTSNASMHLSDPALQTTESLSMLECLRSAARVLQKNVNNQTRRRLQDADEQLSSAIASIMSENHINVTNDFIFHRTGVKRTLSEMLGAERNCPLPPPFYKFVTEPNKEGRLASWLKPGLGLVTTSLVSGCRILLEQVRTKAMRTIYFGGTCNFRKALVTEFRDTCCDRQQETCLTLLGRKTPGSPSCLSCVVWVGLLRDILASKIAGANIQSAGSIHLCVSKTDDEENQISIIPPLKTTARIPYGDGEGDCDGQWCTVQLANLQQYNFFYHALTKMCTDSNGTSVSVSWDSSLDEPVSGHKSHPAVRAWLGLPDQVGRKPTTFTPSSTLDEFLGARGHRHKLIAFSLVST